ncbi:MAG: hypothetical protein ACR650_11540 [Methylocystis sp.]
MAARVYTKKGDAGKTSLFSVRCAEKFNPRVAAVGDLEELSARPRIGDGSPIRPRTSCCVRFSAR